MCANFKKKGNRVNVANKIPEVRLSLRMLCYPEGRSHFLSRSDMNFTENRTLKMSLKCSYFLKLKHLLCWFVTTTPNTQGADAREKPRQTKSFHSPHHLTSHHLNKCILMTDAALLHQDDEYVH